MGIINALHTTGENPAYHPYVHSLVTIEGLYSTKRMKATLLLKKQMEFVRGITPIERRLEERTLKCPVCGKKLVQSKRFDSYTLWNYVKWYLIDGVEGIEFPLSR